MTFPINGPIAVTGATGYVAGHVVRELLARGATVHATARNPSDASKVGHLLEMAAELPGSLKLFKADLLEDGAFSEAFAGCEVVIHTASPFLIGKQSDPQKSLVDPALKGTRNVLNTVNETESVHRVVLTSSVIAVYGDAVDCAAQGGNLTEEHWNYSSSLSHSPYGYSKTVAERAAWTMAEGQERWKLVVINPGFVMGPSLTSRNDSASIDFLLNLINGKHAAGMSDFWTPWVDVRDVAFAHVEATVRPYAEGRHILAGKNAPVFEVIKGLKEDMPDTLALPRIKVPKWLAYTVGPFFGFSWKYIKRNVEIPVHLDNSRSINALGVNYRPLRDTMREHVSQLIDDGLYTPKPRAAC